MTLMLGASGLVLALSGPMILSERLRSRTAAATRRLLRRIRRRARDSTVDEAASDPGSEALAMDLEVREDFTDHDDTEFDVNGEHDDPAVHQVAPSRASPDRSF